MKITLFTSNKLRHTYLMNLLAKICDELFVIQESKTVASDARFNHSETGLIKKYFDQVNNAQKKIFNDSNIDASNKNIQILQILRGEINRLSLDSLSEFLKSDYYIVFGSSFIKGDLINFLVEKKNYQYSCRTLSLL